MAIKPDVIGIDPNNIEHIKIAEAARIISECFKFQSQRESFWQAVTHDSSTRFTGS